MATTTAASSSEPRRWHGALTFLLATIVLLLLARIPVLSVRAFDQDELEHSHAAWSVFRGLLPYRDFFEHHTPWYYFALAPFFRFFEVNQSFEQASRFLMFGRAISLALTALSAVLIHRVAGFGSASDNHRVGLLAALFLVGQPVVIQKTLEIRPDVLALPFFLGGLWLLVRGLRRDEDRSARSLIWFLGGGLCLGAAIMCTQKMLFALPGALTALGLWMLFARAERWPTRLLAMLAVGLGLALPMALTWVGFALHGSGAKFVQLNFLLNAKWRLYSNEHLLVTLATSGPILILALLGATVGAYRFLRVDAAGRRDFGMLLLLFTLGGFAAGILVVPAAYRQYYLPPLAIACVFAAQGLVFLVDLAKTRLRARILLLATLPLLAWPVVDLARSFFVRRDDRQTARLRYVFAHTGPEDPVLDGWLGTNVFRPHPLYYFFMHGELRAMLSEADKEAIVEALESGKARPALIALDYELLNLGPRFARFVLRNYESKDGLFYHPKSTKSGPR